jgi:TonB family protein
MQRLTFRLTIALLSGLLSLSASVFSAAAQEKPSGNDDGGRWERYTGKGEAFTVLLPVAPSATVTYRPTRFMFATEAERYRGTLYSAYSDGVVYLIYSFPRRSEPLKQFVTEFSNRYARMQSVVSTRTLNRDGVSGERYLIKLREVDGVLDFYLTEKRVYILHIIGGDESHPSVKRFLESFRLRDAAGADKAADTVAIEIRPTSKNSLQLFEAREEADPVYTSSEVTRKAVIIVRPEPQYTEAARAARVSGTVVLKVVLASTGKVTQLEAETTLPRGLTEKAMEAARQLIFLPAMKDGKAVSQRVHVEYNFSVY